MIYYTQNIPDIGITPAEYDPTTAQVFLGTYGMKRAKRDGRNPATGARGSRKSGQTITFITGYLPLQTGSSEPIY